MATYGNHLIVFIMLGAVCSYLSVDAGKCLIDVEPKPGEHEPDLNITVLPSRMGQVGEEINITCHAGGPRFPLGDTVDPKGVEPRLIEIFVGVVMIKQCPDKISLNEVTECKSSLRLTNTTIAVSCSARNRDRDCRVKTVNITTVINMPTSTMVTSTENLMSTPIQENHTSTPTQENLMSTPTQENVTSTPTQENVTSTPTQGNTTSTTTPSSASGWTAKYLKRNVIVFVSFVLLLL